METLLFLSLILVSWFPVKGALQGVVYGLPLVVLFYGLLSGRLRWGRYGWLVNFAFIALILLGALWHAEDFLPLNFALGLLTYGSLALLGWRWRNPERLFHVMVAALAFTSIFEFMLGLAQLYLMQGTFIFRYGGDGDAVVGTLLTHSHLLVVKLWLQAFVLMCAYGFGFRAFYVLPGVVASVLGAIYGSAIFVSVLFFAAVGVIVLWSPLGRMWRLRGVVVVAGILGFLVFGYTQRDNLEYLEKTLRVTFGALVSGEELRLGKARAVQRSWNYLSEHGTQMIFGAGLGQYSSRAAMILTGEYLSDQAGDLPVSMSEATYENIYPLWNRISRSIPYQDGVLQQPFQSVQSWVMELGLVGLLIVVLAALALGMRLSQVVASEALRFVGFGLLVLVPVLCLSDNWLEYPSFMLPVVLLISLIFSYRGHTV